MSSAGGETVGDGLVQQYVDEYLEAGRSTEPAETLFRCAVRSRKDRLTERPMRGQTANRS